MVLSLPHMRIPALTASAAMVLVCSLGASSVAMAQDPQRFTSATGHFSITFPGAVEESTDTTALDDGRILTLGMASHAPNDDVVYMASWTDMSNVVPDDASIKSLLENSRDGSTGSMGATEVKTLALDPVGIHPFIEFTFGSDAMVGRERIYFVNKTQYALMTIFANVKSVPASAEAFIRSFTFDPPAKK